MSKSKRYHPPERIADHPLIQNAFKTIGAMLIATNASDFEADFTMGDLDGNLKQFHIEVEISSSIGAAMTNPNLEKLRRDLKGNK